LPVLKQPEKESAAMDVTPIKNLFLPVFITNDSNTNIG
jgi:hypothetical protein